LVFTLIGAYLLKKKNNLLLSYKTSIPFVLILSLIHAVCEVIVSTVFYFNDNSSINYVYNILLLVGVGTVIHSTVDFIMASIIWAPMQNAISIPSNARIRFRSVKSH